MFPNQDNSIKEKATLLSNVGSGVILSFDFETGEFNMKDGKVIELTGLEGLKMWVQKVLRTEKHKFKIYKDTDHQYAYGITLLDYIKLDLPFDFKKAELQKEITETLINNKAITSVTNFSFERVNDKLNISFTIHSIYGITEEGASLNGIE